MYTDWYLAAIGGHVNTSAGGTRAYGWERRLAALWPAVKDSLRAWVERQLLRQELEAMTPSELDDIGMNPAEIPAIVKAYPQAGRLQQRIMTRLGLDRKHAVGAWPAVMRAVGSACVKCGERKRCERWLESGAANDSYRAFCPNAYRFAAVKVWQARRHVLLNR